MTSQETAVTVAVLAADPLVAQGAFAYLLTCPGIKPVRPDRLDHASVVLVMAGQVGEKTLSLMQHAAELIPGRRMRFVLVCDGIQEPQLLRVLSWGTVSVLPWQEADYEQIARVLVSGRVGKAKLPGDAHARLAERDRSIQPDMPAPRGLTTAGLYAREIDVLRLLADGMETIEVAQRLNYSERTVRNIIHGLLSRMKLHNRVQAVAYALRNGVM